MSGARTALIIVQKEASVKFPDSSFTHLHPLASVELLAFQVRLDTFQVIWNDTAKGTFTVYELFYPPLHDPVEFAADVATGDIQVQIHPFRVLLARAYYEASMSLLSILERHAAGGGK
ncbi:MAG: hypothetical protein ABIU05_04545 [Nitrospirales bacterium]